MHTLSVAIITLLLAVICLQFAEYESVKISPKLDFVESKEENSSKGKSPKIQGVRVIVDTTKGKKSTESKSAEDDGDDDTADATGKKKTVGIRTDITLEITEEDDDDSAKNQTTKTGGKKPKKDVVDEDDDDDSTADKDRRVPVIKGSGTGGGAPKPGPPSSEEGWNIHNVPVVYGKDVQSRRSGGSKPDTWISRPAPLPIWTTERPPPRPLYYLTDYQSNRGPPFKPIPQTPWKPCRCQPQPSYSQWKTYRPDHRTFVRPIETRPPSGGSSSHGVDDKLEYPFTSSDSEY